ncbi:MAG TPA: DUF475 domain-containing protein [Patescibacteria group bacterium]|jgi:hypothetical protein|nr:DUF475 domain-containing protein [Patescibacteria group bacterium]
MTATMLHKNHPLRIFGISALFTVALGVVVTMYGGLVDLWLYAILVVLEVTFSFDNAVINSKILSRMSRLWQTIFLTVGIIIAVFIVRFALPIIIVMFAGSTGFSQVIDMALNHPEQYSQTLHQAAPVINAFGGAFLLMLGTSYFIDRKKDIHWLSHIESRLAQAGKYENFKALIMLGLALILYITVDEAHRTIVLVSALFGIVLHMLLEVMGAYFAHHQSNAKELVGWAAFMSFLYLEVLDSSFSLDGVIGAFAITPDVLLIMAGLGIGALWVRSLTIYLVRTHTLGKYRYLEHGAHWAIFALGAVMVLKLYHVEPPEWMVGSLGIVFVMTAVISSILERRRKSHAS